jgi:G3E family GTPase
MIPITVFTGYLGAGKTTIILNLIKSLKEGYKVVWLKNEFGDIEIDSELAKENNISVKEMVNGCLCCVLVGKLGEAIKQIIQEYHPDRIIIETSGSAYPAPIVWEINKLIKEGLDIKQDGVINVIDAINFSGYEDKSYTAKIQAKYNDLILINKHEEVSEKDLDTLLDDVYDLNPLTPKVKTNKGEVSSNLIFGLDSKLIGEDSEIMNKDHQHLDGEVYTYSGDQSIERDILRITLESLSPKYFFRIKGVSRDTKGAYIFNYVFGKVSIENLVGEHPLTKLLFIGKSIDRYIKDIEDKLNIKLTNHHD